MQNPGRKGEGEGKDRQLLTQREIEKERGKERKKAGKKEGRGERNRERKITEYFQIKNKVIEIVSQS